MKKNSFKAADFDPRFEQREDVSCFLEIFKAVRPGREKK